MGNINNKIVKMCDEKNPSDLKLVLGEFDKEIITSSTIYEPAPATD